MTSDSSYPNIIIPKQIFDMVLNELENHHGWTLDRGSYEYADEIQSLIETLESYDSSPTTIKEDK